MDARSTCAARHASDALVYETVVGDRRSSDRGVGVRARAASAAADLARHRLPEPAAARGRGPAAGLDAGADRSGSTRTSRPHDHFVCESLRSPARPRARARGPVAERKLRARGIWSVSAFWNSSDSAGIAGERTEKWTERKESHAGIVERNEDAREPEARVRRRVAGEPPLPLLRPPRRHRGLSRTSAASSATRPRPRRATRSATSTS